MKRRRTKIRFAKHADGQIKCDIHEIPHISDPDLWWQAEEFSSIRGLQILGKTLSALSRRLQQCNSATYESRT